MQNKMMTPLIAVFMLASLSVAFSLTIPHGLSSSPNIGLQRFLDFVPLKERSLAACNQYHGMYNQCLPPVNWMCDKPADYKVFNKATFIQELVHAPDVIVNHLSAACLGNAKDKTVSKVYIKHPVCREVKTLIEFVNLGNEVCQVVFNNEEANIQKLYRTECLNGDPSVKAEFRQRCAFDYGTKVDYYCKPTNFVSRKIAVHCPVSGFVLTTHKVATACSCVKMSCQA